MAQAWISEPQITVLFELADTLDRLGIPWMAAGGLAGNLWGSAWPLHDIDLDVPTASLELLARTWAPFVTWNGRWVDHEFDIELLRLVMHAVEVDLSGADDAFLFSRGERLVLPNTLSGRVLRPLGPRAIPCQHLDDLIAYKTAIGRTADVDDLMKWAP